MNVGELKEILSKYPDSFKVLGLQGDFYYEIEVNDDYFIDFNGFFMKKKNERSEQCVEIIA